MRMSSKLKYVTAVVILLALVLLAASYSNPDREREWQHLVYNTQVEDKNLSIDAEGFSSRLPVVVIDTKGQTIPGKPDKGQHVSSIVDSFIQADIRIMEEEGVLHTLQDKPNLESRADIRIRGNSSRTFDKLGYLIRFTDAQGGKASHQVMGMEADSNWVLHGPYLDKTLMRNYMWYNLSGQIMEWAPDARYCEVFLNDSYQGVYVMTEQIDVGDGRIEVTKYAKNTPISSYIICVDRENMNETQTLNNFTKYAKRLRSTIEIKYPGDVNLTPQVAEYINEDFSKFEKALYSYDYDSARFGYETYIDVDSFVDYLIINEVSQNTDAGIFSTYMYKDVAGKLKLAVWDFNNCCDNYVEAELPLEGYLFQHRTWMLMLMKDEKFIGRIIDRYQDLRKNILSDAVIRESIRQQREYLGCAVERNYQVWGYTFEPDYNLLEGSADRAINSYEEAVEQYETRLINRMHWMDEHIEDLQFYSHESINKKFNH